MIKNKYVKFAVFVVLVILFYNLFDFLFTVLITRSEYTFKPGSGIFSPLLTGIVAGALFFLRKGSLDEDTE